MIINNFFICIFILCMICLLILCQNNIYSGGNINDASKRKIESIKNKLEEDLKHTEYNTNKYSFKINIEHLIEKNLKKFKYFQTYGDFVSIFNEYKGNLKSNLSDEKKKINMIIKLINNRYYNLVKHIIVKLFLHILEIDTSNTFKYSGGNLNTIHDILNHKEFYKYYFNLDDDKIKSLTNSKYSYNQLIVMDSNDSNINKNNILKYPSCWGETPTTELDKWEKINKFIDQVCLYLNKYIDINSNISLINEMMYSLELIKRTLNNETDNRNKFINISKLFLKHIVNYSNSNTFSIIDILQNNNNVLDIDIQNILKLKNNKDLIKNILDYIDISFNKEKIRDLIKLPNNIIPTTLPQNINKFENYIKYNKIYTKIILNNNDLNLETTIRDFLKQNDYVYDVNSNISNTILDNIFEKIKEKISSKDEPDLYEYVHFVCKNNLSLDYSDVLSIINDNSNISNKKELVFKISKENTKNDIKVSFDETFDLITKLIKSKYHKLTKNNNFFNIDILTKRKLNDLFFNNIDDTNKEVNVYSIKNSINKYTTYKTDDDSLKYKIKVEQNINDPNNKKIDITWTSDGHTKILSKTIDYFYIDNVLFFINNIEQTSSLFKTSTPINYIYFEENLIQYLERSSLDNHYLTKEKFENSADAVKVDTISIKQAQNYQNYTSAPIDLVSNINTYKTESINALDNIYKGGSNNKENNYLIDSMYKRLAVYDKVNRKYEIPASDLPSQIGDYDISELNPPNKEKLKLTIPTNLQNKFDNIKEKISDFSVFDKESSFINKVLEQPNFYNENYELLDKAYNHKIKYDDKYNNGTYLITGLEKNINNDYEFYITNIYKIIDKNQIKEQIEIINTKSALVKQDNISIDDSLGTSDILEKLNLNNKKILNNVKLDYYNTKLNIYTNNALELITNNDTTINFQNNLLSFNNNFKNISIKDVSNKLEKFDNTQISTLDIKNNFIILMNNDFNKFNRQIIFKDSNQITSSISSDTIIIERWPDFVINVNVKNKLLNLEYIKKKLIYIIRQKIVTEILKITNAIDTDKYTKWFNKIRLQINILFKHIEDLQISLYKSLSPNNPTYFNFEKLKEELKNKNIVFKFDYEQNFINKIINNLSLNNIDDLSTGLLNSLLFDTKKIVEDIKLNEPNTENFIELTGSINLSDDDIVSILNVPNTPISTVVPTGSSSTDIVTNFRAKLNNFVQIEYEQTGSNSPFFCIQLKDTTGKITDTWILRNLPSQNIQSGGGLQNLKLYCSKNDCNKYTNKKEFLDLLNINTGLLAIRNQIKLNTNIILNVNLDNWQKNKKYILNDFANKLNIKVDQINVLNVTATNNTPSAVQRGGNYILGGNTNISIDFAIEYLFENIIDEVIYNLNKIKKLINNNIPIFLGNFEILNLSDYIFIKHDEIIERDSNINLDQSENIKDINIKDILLKLVNIYETINFDKIGIPWSKKYLEDSDEILEIDNNELKNFYYILDYYLPSFLNHNINNQIWDGKTQVKIKNSKIVNSSSNNDSDIRIKLLEIYGIICNIRFNLFSIIDNMLNYNFKINHSKWIDKTNIVEYPNDDDKKLPNQNSKLKWNMHANSNCIFVNLETDPDINNKIINEHKIFYEENINNKFKDYNIKLRNYEKDESQIVIKYYDILNDNYEKILNKQILDIFKIKNDLKIFKLIPENVNIYTNKPIVYLKHILKDLISIDYKHEDNLTVLVNGNPEKIKHLSFAYAKKETVNNYSTASTAQGIEKVNYHTEKVYYSHLRKFFWKLKSLFPGLSVNINNFINKNSNKTISWKIKDNKIEPKESDLYSKQTINLLYIIGIITKIKYNIVKIIRKNLPYQFTTNYENRTLEWFANGINQHIPYHFENYKPDVNNTNKRDTLIIDAAMNSLMISIKDNNLNFKEWYTDTLWSKGYKINSIDGKFFNKDVKKILYSNFIDYNYEKIKQEIDLGVIADELKSYGLISNNIEIII